jgi:hypothetical protein
MTSVRDVGTVPPQLRRPDGLSRYRLPNATIYTTTTQLNTEAAILARARSTGATVVAGPALELARVELQAAGLSTDQQAAVLQVLSSGRRGDVLIGPAGAGKSRTVGALAVAWQTAVGGRVLGLATSQIATRVLVDDGLTAINTSQFLARFGPDAHGRVRERLHSTDLLVLDEAGMSSTAELDEISALVAQAGAKLLYTGDHQQLAAVGAGGMLELLVGDAGAIELTRIHRFTHGWERAASTRLRAGDPGCTRRVRRARPHPRWHRPGDDRGRGPRLPGRRTRRSPLSAGRAGQRHRRRAVRADPRRAGRGRPGGGRGARAYP